MRKNLLSHFITMGDILVRKAWASISEKAPESTLFHQQEGFVFSDDSKFNNVI